MLIAFLTEGVDSFAGRTDAQLVDVLVQQLRTMFPGVTVPTPVAWKCARWVQNPLFRGAWSYNRVGIDPPTDFPALQQGSTWRLQFAGEHTDPHRFGTLFGAWESGQRAASAVVRGLRSLG